MVHIRPFKAIHYNLEEVADLSDVVCPPYDVINDKEQDFYYQKSPYNFIRLILNKKQSGDNEDSNVYSRAALFFKEWLKNEVLKGDEEEALYFYKQDFYYNDKEFTRLGFFGVMQLNDSGVVLPHEDTHQAAKDDRLELIKKVHANLSPIFTIFPDKENVVERIFKKEFAGKKPDLCVKDVQGIRNSIWRLTNKKQIAYIQKVMRSKRIFIADGHHRYEVANTYAQLMRDKEKVNSLGKGYNYQLTYFAPMESKGLCIMPIHRLVHAPLEMELLKEVFKVKELKSVFDLEDSLSRPSMRRILFGVCHDGKTLLLELKDKRKISQILKDKKCFRNLEVAIADTYVLKEILKISKEKLSYTKDINEARDFADKNKSFFSFILPPIGVQQIQQVALCSERMPPKSSYFYPKLLSGLVVHKF